MAAEQVRFHYLASSGLPDVLFFHRVNYLLAMLKLKIYWLLTKFEVKMAGYWPSCFFLHVYGTRQSRGPYTRKKKNQANIQPSWLNKLGQACSSSQSQGRN